MAAATAVPPDENIDDYNDPDPILSTPSILAANNCSSTSTARSVIPGAGISSTTTEAVRNEQSAQETDQMLDPRAQLMRERRAARKGRAM